ncbi:Beta-lactamase [Phytophthora megakarya]|uniref:Beta-lactamase n=1 Tax=Phytophthora megakarya TaxID=4795 RepID=A0A225UD90_9STRA|nr:Beta-lactamase [Phytophthora megakarya]
MPVMGIDRNAAINLDTHRLLGLPADAALPDGFHDPVVFNLLGISETRWYFQLEADLGRQKRLRPRQGDGQFARQVRNCP